jgi:hypothetical protein
MRSAYEKKRRTNRPPNKTAKTTPCTVQIIGEFGADWLGRLPKRDLTRRAKQEHDVIMADVAHGGEALNSDRGYAESILHCGSHNSHSEPTRHRSSENIELRVSIYD